MNEDSIWIFAVIVLIFLLWTGAAVPEKFNLKDRFINTEKKEEKKIEKTESKRPLSAPSIGGQQTNVSPYKGKIKISSAGNAKRTNWPNDEYVIIKNVSKDNEPIVITGWKLKNGRDRRFFIDNLNKLSRGVSDVAVIPSGINTLYGSNMNYLNPISLKKGEKAIITTGKPNKKASFMGFSFKVNKCGGYINELPGYPLAPRISSRCPSPKNETDIDSLEDKCLKFVKGLRSCHIPVYKEVIMKDGERREYLNRTYGLSSYCRQYINKHFDYKWCVANHISDKDFEGKEWRIYLGRNLYLWNNSRDIIGLYDKDGLLVDELKY